MSTEGQSERVRGPRAKAAAPAGGNGPTLVVGVGAFGADILRRLGDARLAGVRPARRCTEEAEQRQITQHTPPPASEGRVVLLEIDASAAVDEQVEQIVHEAEGLLGLGAALHGTNPGDERRPMLDVLLVADLAEPAVAESLPRLLRSAGTRLLQRFSNIFPGHDLPNLTLCPVVALIGVRQQDATVEPQKALADLEAQAGKVSFRAGEASPVARVFVVEQQSSRYELTPTEVASTVVAFLAVLLGTALRHQEPLRSFLRSSVDQTRQHRIFASFGCATLELNLESYCVARACADLVDGMRAAASAGVGEQEVPAERLVPDAEVLQLELQKPKSGDDLVALLRAHTPHIDFPPIGLSATPETVREVSYGWGWFDALESAVQAQVERLDEREMDEVTRVADERGLKQLRHLERDVRRAVRGAEQSGPQGWADALRLAEQIRDRADRQVDRLGDELKKDKLPEFPPPTAVESAFRTLREESTLRPRPRRMASFGVLSALAIAALMHHVPKWIAVAVIQRQVPLLSLSPTSMDVDVGLGRYLLDPPYAFVWVLLVVGAAIGWWLTRYREKRHSALLAARRSLQAAVERYLTDEVGASVRRYYESRLHFTLRAWTMRALRRVREVAGDEVARLSAISAALDRLSREFRAEAKRAERTGPVEGGDLVYRTHLSAELLRATYAAARPGADLATKLFAEIEPVTRDDDVPEYLLPDRLRAFIRPYVEPTEAQLTELAGPVVSRFVAELHGKLGVPLEVHGFDERTAEQRCLFAPAWARGALEQLRTELPTLPEVQTHADPDRVHALTMQTALNQEAIALPTRAPTTKGGAS